ncbi:MAG: ABC transporter ATP-binding protein [Gemmatimonadetes bacterium]|nr:ABC transporter ATP-binding protein [Gemmatimonadota bacterium]
MIEADGLTRRFGERVAVDDVSFRLEPGQLCALLGPNGAGKTTIIRMLLGLVGPSAGGATVAGIRIPGTPAGMASLRARVGLLTETPGLYDRLSALENLTLFGRLYRLSGSDLSGRIERELRRLDLWDRRDDPAGTFSKGMKQRLAIARAIFHDPDVVFLDEPTAGLDPEASRDVRQLIGTLKRAGRTIIVCSHNLAEAAALADVVAVMKQRLIAFGPVETLGGSGQGVRCRLVAVDPPERLGGVIAAAAPIGGLARVGNSFEFTVRDPVRALPAIVAAVVAAGVGVVEVRPLERSLEEIYLSLVGADHA